MLNLFYFASHNLQEKWKIGGFHYAIKKSVIIHILVIIFYFQKNVSTLCLIK